jgi:cell division protein FtsI (penicillin-binding protein 3)
MPPHHNTQSFRTAAWARVLIYTIVVLMLAQLGRVVQLKISDDPRLVQHAGSSFSNRAEPARRGELLDRRGRLIATSTLGYRLFVDPQVVSDLATLPVELAERIGGDPVDIDRAILPRRHTRYAVVSELLEDWQVDAIRKSPIRGVVLQPRLVRHYPHGDLAAHIVGMVGYDHVGLGGAEHLFDNRLRQEDGKLRYLRDVRGRALWIELDGYQPSREGDSVRLSIDLVIQESVEQRLRQAVKEYNAGGGRMVVLDVHTGEILAMADILNPREGWNEITEDPGRMIHPALGRNRCATDPYEPGSTFKPFVWAAATELGKAVPEEVLPTPAHGKHRTSRGRFIGDAFNYAGATWREVLIKSLNSGMAIVAERMTPHELQHAVRRFGFGARTNSGIPGETAGIVTTARRWTHHSQTSVPMGHEIAVTPLQMVRAFSVIARDGTMPPLRITAVSPDDDEFEIVHRVLSESAAMLTREILRDVMTEGTGRRAKSDRYQMFAKSGTAQLPRREGRGYYDNRYVSSFIAGAPFEEPRIVVLCVMDDPDAKIGYYGGAIAGPVVRDIIDEALTYLGVPPDQPRPDRDRLVAR